MDVCIPHHKYRVKARSSSWFSADYAAVITHGNQFFRLYQCILHLNWSLDRLVLYAKGFLMLPNLLILLKQICQFSETWFFWWTAISILNKDKSAIHPLLNDPEVLASAPDKAKFLAKNFSKNSNLDNTDTYLPALSSINYLKLHIYVTPNLVKKVITSSDLSKVSSPDCIPF